MSKVSSLRRTLRIAVRIFVGVLVASVTIGIVAIAYNNRDVDRPGRAELSASLEASVVWLVDSKDTILTVNNPILWYFLLRAAEVSGDQRVQTLVDAYVSKYLDWSNGTLSRQQRIWLGMFEPGFRFSSLSFDDVSRMSYYNQHFAYALNCDRELGKLDSIKAQNEAEFCGRLHFLRPTCTTHQLMGLRMLQRTLCEDADQLALTVEQLQSKILRELKYDSRVVDVYIQRAMMLAESGALDSVASVWVRRILDNQQVDGGWGNFQPIFSLNDEKRVYFGFGHSKSRTGKPRAGKTYLRIFGVGDGQSTFHATAQGVLLLTLLVHSDWPDNPD